nr:putative ribonuclease H-like domain-containing protein [Tanacetum cinerariifolium]
STVNAAGTNKDNELPFDPNMPALEDVSIFNFSNNDEDDGEIEKEVYVCRPLGFEDPGFPDRVYMVEKALYGLHHAPRAWYETLSTYLLDNGFQRGKINKTSFIKRHKCDILLVQVYVDDIIFGSTKKELCNAFKRLMHEKF